MFSLEYGGLDPLSTVSGLTVEQIDELREIFLVYDKDGNGMISAKELGSVLRSAGQNPSEAELEEMIGEGDSDGDSTVSFREFLVLMAEKVKEPVTDVELRAAFQAFDKNHDGFISENELRHVMASLGKRLTDGEVDELLKEVDVNGDGRINYEEFILLRSKQ